MKNQQQNRELFHGVVACCLALAIIYGPKDARDSKKFTAMTAMATAMPRFYGVCVTLNVNYIT